MGHKRTRNHYPRLPEAVQNLLALHSLSAVPVKQRWASGASRGWVWNVFSNSYTLQPVFSAGTTDSLQSWIEKVDKYVKYGPAMSLDFETYQTRKLAVANFASFDEYAKFHWTFTGDPACAVTKVPSSSAKTPSPRRGYARRR